MLSHFQKKPPRSIEKDIRPISLNQIVSKIFESIVIKWVDHDFGKQHYLVALTRAVESHPTPGDIRGNSSPSGSISGVSSHVADGGSARVPHECVQPSLSRAVFTLLFRNSDPT